VTEVASLACQASLSKGINLLGTSLCPIALASSSRPHASHSIGAQNKGEKFDTLVALLLENRSFKGTVSRDIFSLGFFVSQHLSGLVDGILEDYDFFQNSLD
jgi:hypothetical protein